MNNDGVYQWQVGIIRWMQTIGKQGVEIGGELIGEKEDIGLYQQFQYETLKTNQTLKQQDTEKNETLENKDLDDVRSIL
ncbi:MAG: hypothetical protein ACC657_05450 [Thiohalomonadales bacterium]